MEREKLEGLEPCEFKLGQRIHVIFNLEHLSIQQRKQLKDFFGKEINLVKGKILFIGRNKVNSREQLECQFENGKKGIISSMNPDSLLFVDGDNFLGIELPIYKTGEGAILWKLFPCISVQNIDKCKSNFSSVIQWFNSLMNNTLEKN